MNSYLKNIADRPRAGETDGLLFELDTACTEAAADGTVEPSARARELHELVRFCNFDAIAPWLKSERDAVTRALAFARRIGDDSVARILAEALNGTPQPSVQFSLALPGQAPQPLAVDAGEATKFDGKDWGGTDLALSFAIQNFGIAVLREIIAAENELTLLPPRSVRARSATDARISAAANQSAAALFRTLIAARNPRMEIGAWPDENPSAHADKIIAIEHEAESPAAAATLVALRKQYGEIAQPLLDVYACHDGAALFKYADEPGFYLAPVAEWDTLKRRAVEWAEEVTWQDEKDSIPSYLYTAIAFGMNPGDSELWLFITAGPHAGKILRSDTDLIEDSPRFESLAHFFAAALHDVGRVLNCSGHVSYTFDDTQLYPIRYRHD